MCFVNGKLKPLARGFIWFWFPNLREESASLNKAAHYVNDLPSMLWDPTSRQSEATRISSGVLSQRFLRFHAALSWWLACQIYSQIGDFKLPHEMGLFYSYSIVSPKAPFWPLQARLVVPIWPANILPSGIRQGMGASTNLNSPGA